VLESNDIIKYLDEKYPDKPIFAKSGAQQKEQEKWMEYADEDLVQILPANIYRTLPEALHSFKYITKVGKFPVWKRYFLAMGGAVAMNIVANKGMKKKGIKDPRKALEESLGRWSSGLGKKKFMGGAQPDVSDLVVAGILSAVKEMKVWEFIQGQKPVAEWYDRVRAS
jgi:microsomal prostaglandin-E synthase 2